MGIQITLERREAQILGSDFQFDGQLEPAGRLLDYLNSGNRTIFPLYDVTIHAITPDKRLAGIARSEVYVSSRQLGLIYFLDSEFRGQVQLLKHFDRVIAYTPHAVLRGNFHRGAETRLGDLLDMVQGSFLAMSDVNVFPLSKLPAPFPPQADLLIINRHFVQLYHEE